MSEVRTMLHEENAKVAAQKAATEHIANETARVYDDLLKEEHKIKEVDAKAEGAVEWADEAKTFAHNAEQNSVKASKIANDWRYNGL